MPPPLLSAPLPLPHAWHGRAILARTTLIESRAPRTRQLFLGVTRRPLQEGTYSVTITFNPYRFKKHVSRVIFRMRKAIENTIWPLTPALAGGTCAAVAIRVLTAPSNSWWRSGGIAHVLWQWDEMFPWEKNLPTNVRVAWLSLVAASCGLCGISFVQVRAILSESFRKNPRIWHVPLP